MYTCGSFILIAACLTGMARQQDADRAIVSVSAAETKVVPGKKGYAMIQVKVKEGYHIQANIVTHESLIPVELEITSARYFRTGKPEFPPYKLFQLEGSEDYLNVLDSLFTIRLPIKAAGTTPAGTYLIKARLRYQACNARTCLFPKTLELDIPVIVKRK